MGVKMGVKMGIKMGIKMFQCKNKSENLGAARAKPNMFELCRNFRSSRYKAELVRALLRRRKFTEGNRDKVHEINS